MLGPEKGDKSARPIASQDGNPGRGYTSYEVSWVRENKFRTKRKLSRAAAPKLSPRPLTNNFIFYYLLLISCAGIKATLSLVIFYSNDIKKAQINYQYPISKI